MITMNGQPLRLDSRCERTNKVKYEKPEAVERAQQMRDEGLTCIGHYHCKACGTWHIGNDRRKR